jgi:uncharacterized protein YkwD
MLKSAVRAIVLWASFTLSTSAMGAHAAQPARLTPERQLLAIINHDRAAAGLAPLHLGRRLTQVAVGHSYFMARLGRLSHDGPGTATPYTRMAGNGIHYRIAGENVGLDYGASEGAMLQAIESAMLTSPEHRANLLRASFTHIGLGIVTAGDRLYVTEDFTG